MKYLEKLIVTYFKNQRSDEGLDEGQKDLVFVDAFTRQMAPDILDSYKAYNRCAISVIANITKYYQPLDLKGNCEAKRFLKCKFVDW